METEGVCVMQLEVQNSDLEGSNPLRNSCKMSVNEMSLYSI